MSAFNSVVPNQQLVDAVEDALKRRGVLKKLKAQMRAEVFHSLEDKTINYPSKPPDVHLAAELIKEFLMLFNLDSTLSVFCEEMGQPMEMAVDRDLIGLELGLNPAGCDSKIPMLLSLIQYLKKDSANFLKHAGKSIEVEADTGEESESDHNSFRIPQPRMLQEDDDMVENDSVGEDERYEE